MTALATDNFDRANAATLGSNWTTVTGLSTTIQILSNVAQNTDDTADEASYYNAVTWPNDHYSKAVVTLSGNVGVDNGVGLFARVSASAYTTYRMVWSKGQTNPLTIGKVVNGTTFTHLASIAATVVNGDTLGIEAQGTTLRATQNGTSKGSSTDSALTAGNAGITHSSDGTGKTSTWDNWEGGDFSVSSLPPGLGPVEEMTMFDMAGIAAMMR